MAVFGHNEIVEALLKRLPRVSLFIGPPSVGKWTTAEHVRREYGINDRNVLRVRTLTAQATRDVQEFASFAPAGEDEFRLVIIRLDGSLPANQDSILKFVEEAPTTRFIFIARAATDVLETMRSRSTVFWFRLLTDQEMEEVLRYRYKMGKEAAALVPGARGQVSRAVKKTERDAHRPTVVAALQAIQNRDAEALERLAPKWEQEHTELIVHWCNEKISGRWFFFTGEETDFTTNAVPLRILTSLATETRPRLALRAALMGVLKGE